MHGSIPVFARWTESIAHDSVKRLLERQPHHTEALYDEAKRLIRADKGVLVIDDSTLDKPYSHQIQLVTRHWSGKHHRVVQGINLISTIWIDGSAIVLIDFRIYCPDKDGKTKMIISGICSEQRMNESFSQVVLSSIHGIRVSIIWNWSVHWSGIGAPDSNPIGWLIRIIRTIVRFPILISLPKEELFTWDNTVLSRCSGSFIPTRNPNTGLPIFWMRRNPTENRSRILEGISKSITGALSSAVASRDARVARRLYNEVIFCSRYSLFFASKPIDWGQVPVGMNPNARFIDLLLLSLSRHRRSNLIIFKWDIPEVSLFRQLQPHKS